MGVALFLQEERGFEFESDTDTEVIPKLLKYLYQTQVSSKWSTGVLLHLLLLQKTNETKPVFQELVEQAIQQLVR